MKGYKAFNSDWTCRGFQYEIGKMYELPEGQELEMCKCGFHFCKNPIDVFGYYPMDDSTMIAEVEALGEIQQEGTKYCTDKIKIVKEFTWQELRDLILKGHHNSGDYNTGNGNTGDYNSGKYNSGNNNAGDDNSGHHNFGNLNTGNGNAGHYNAGHYNSGHYNAGHYNSGHYNSGDFNSGNYNTGIFNTDEPYMRAFNKDTHMTLREFISTIPFDFYMLCSRIKTGRLCYDDYARIKALPNFDAAIFKEITGIEIT